MSRVLLATRNQKKLTELRRILVAEAVHGVEIVGLADLPEFPDAPETGATFEENALAKARDAVRETGLPVIADDSGIAVDALNGMPGVLSARWSGGHGDDQANLRLLLGQLTDVPDERRGGGFVSVVAFVLPDGTETTLRGEWRGTIAREPSGGNGFGYDPIFVPEGETRSSAEMAPEEKDAVSHRGRALRLLVPYLRVLAQD